MIHQSFLVGTALLFVGFTAFAQANCEKGDCLNGDGVRVYPSGARYKGLFKDGNPEGRGELHFSDGRLYVGEWRGGQRNGLGVLTYADGGKYTGLFQQNKKHGQGVMVYANGNRYEGQWATGHPHGQGTFTYANGDSYEGFLAVGQCDGQGIMRYADGSVYEGEWKANTLHGNGQLTFADGQVAKGRWNEGQYLTDWKQYAFQGDTATIRNCNAVFCQSGTGRFTYSNGSVFIGFFREGQPTGRATVYYADGNRYEGQWERHTPHGPGLMTYADGRQIGAVWTHGHPTRKLYLQDQPSTPATVTIDHDPKVKIWAVVIGAAHYQNMPTLRYTDDDAYQIYAFLKSPEGGALPDEQVKVLIDEQATRKNILAAMRQTFLRADENDVVLFYFSGHGLEGAFLPIDYDGYHHQLEHEVVKQVLNQSQAKHKLVLADACHSGSLLAQRAPLKGVLQRYYEAFNSTQGGTALLMSSKGEEYSLEDGGLRSGIFSHFLIRGLKGAADADANRIVTVQELFNYVHQQVRLYTGSIQTPTLTGSFDPRMPVAAVRE